MSRSTCCELLKKVNSWVEATIMLELGLSLLSGTMWCHGGIRGQDSGVSGGKLKRNCSDGGEVGEGRRGMRNRERRKRRWGSEKRRGEGWEGGEGGAGGGIGTISDEFRREIWQKLQRKKIIWEESWVGGEKTNKPEHGHFKNFRVGELLSGVRFVKWKTLLKRQTQINGHNFKQHRNDMKPPKVVCNRIVSQISQSH